MHPVRFFHAIEREAEPVSVDEALDRRAGERRSGDRRHPDPLVPSVWQHMWGNGGRRLLIATGVAVVAMTLLVVATVYVVVLKPGPYNPLGEYPVQQVVSTVPGVMGPAVHVGGVVIVEGTKCNESGEVVGIEASLAWSSIDPRVGSVQIFDAVPGTREPGCPAFHFENEMPAEVIRRTQAAFVRGHDAVVWQIAGVETPISPDGHRGNPRAFQTQNFTIVP